MRAARAALIAIGTAALLFGAVLVVVTNRPVGVLGVAVWLAAATVLHDAVLSPILFGLGWIVRRAGGRLPLAAVAVVQVAALVGGILSLVLLPAIRAKQIGVRNPTVLPLDYAANLAEVWVVLAALTIVGLLLVLVVHARRGAPDR